MTEKPPLAARAGLLVIGLLISSFVAWAAIAEVDEIARGEGKVIPVSKTQIIQSSEPGIVREIAVQPGQVVRRGDLILRLDDTASGSSLGELEAKGRSLRAQVARLKLEETGAYDAKYQCPEDITKVAPAICANEEQLLQAKAGNFNNKLSVMQAREGQRQKELAEAAANITRLTESLQLTEQEQEMLAPMVKRKLVAQTEVLRVEKELTDTRGQLALWKESVGKLEAALREATLQVTELSLQLKQEALAEKTEALSQLSVIEETIRGASSRVANTDIRSPVDGIINTLDVNTVGAYVTPGGVIAGVVPTSEILLVEARLSPRDVAFVRAGQPALIKVSAYDFSIYGGLGGVVETISADSLVDQNNGETYYLVRVKTDTAALVKDGREYAIMPGMIASVDIMTGKKTILAYLMKPINKAREEALRER
ncbi:HlyD family type I secretion periplasmic adaptor subunit [Ensifer sp. T173]|jgi:membrane fusion protein, adhesin transport system|uniref:Membrane fusion protein (MFP) family protein n=1 Tax=Ensifer canadensis TaxID=555315 RepID=A0AAW4FV67_9HYPH|nr:MULTISPECIES: HlyD family type I secretion periplasmic adaptor subunit [Ensifer]MBM3095134.1 HlyD family type I secretion periplasmic adaptor subunit [Ensifer canadensis]NOV19696.1 HlyD family type I secretion periplasmic adaptor subunit [Ensifer canadensis]PSS60412.1 HlyD family type I secretion periplasmic adaptor subunit [Ensifer sp. NM-2]UBI80621.1 HlyD family type I secretion periplasmic adaptor subunit [Ensifer canadensis]